MSRGVNISSAHRQNRALILRLILQNPEISRAKLAEMTHLTAASISNITHSLMEDRWIEESGTIDSVGIAGRKSIGLTIRRDYYRVLAIHMHRKGVSVGLCRLNGTIAEQKDLFWEESEYPHPTQLAHDIKDIVTALAESSETPQAVLGISVGSTGIVDAHRGIVYASLPYQWENIDWGNTLHRLTRYPVIIDNNARGMALAEILFGQHTATSWLVFLFAGWGTGLGVIANGAIFRGSRGVGGELGHVSINWQGELCWCGNRGCLEVYLNQNRVLSVLGVTSPEKMPAALAQAPPRILQELSETLATALVSIVNIYNPSTIVVGGWLDNAWPLLKQPVMDLVTERIRYWKTPLVQVVPSSFGPAAGLLGASAIGLDEWVYGQGAYLWNHFPHVAAMAPGPQDEIND
ncbi:MAG: ROK family transcriptional regulator [Firmicutes bacterium]|jgi:predicted NBD/HSP70 family sugar kinase|nr:ROK family transcriptional regulator [Bacillota bacterium]